MQLTITFHGGTGRYNPADTDISHELTVDVPTGEIDPDDVFVAANRIDYSQADVDNLGTLWQKMIRITLDRASLPSMCTGDTIAIISDAGRNIGGWRCEPIGWSPIPAETVAAQPVS